MRCVIMCCGLECRARSHGIHTQRKEPYLDVRRASHTSSHGGGQDLLLARRGLSLDSSGRRHLALRCDARHAVAYHRKPIAKPSQMSSAHTYLALRCDAVRCVFMCCGSECRALSHVIQKKLSEPYLDVRRASHTSTHGGGQDLLLALRGVCLDSRGRRNLTLRCDAMRYVCVIMRRGIECRAHKTNGIIPGRSPQGGAGAAGRPPEEMGGPGPGPGRRRAPDPHPVRHRNQIELQGRPDKTYSAMVVRW